MCSFTRSFHMINLRQAWFTSVVLPLHLPDTSHTHACTCNTHLALPHNKSESSYTWHTRTFCMNMTCTCHLNAAHSHVYTFTEPMTTVKKPTSIFTIISTTVIKISRCSSLNRSVTFIEWMHILLGDQSYKDTNMFWVFLSWRAFLTS